MSFVFIYIQDYKEGLVVAAGFLRTGFSVVSVKLLNERRRTVIGVPLSSSPKASPPILIPISCDGRPAVAVTDQIRAIAKERLRSRLGFVTRAGCPGGWPQADRAARVALRQGDTCRLAHASTCAAAWLRSYRNGPLDHLTGKNTRAFPTFPIPISPAFDATGWLALRRTRLGPSWTLRSWR